MRKFVLAAAVILTTGTMACAGLGKGIFEQPIINFRDVKVRGLGLSGGSLDIFLSVYNPNGYKLDATQLTYRLLVDSVQFGAGALDSRFTVQNRDSIIVRIPIDFTYAGIGAAGRQLMQTGTVNYRVLGDLTVATPLGNYTHPYSQTGRFSAFGGVSR